MTDLHSCKLSVRDIHWSMYYNFPSTPFDLTINPASSKPDIACSHLLHSSSIASTSTFLMCLLPISPDLYSPLHHFYITKVYPLNAYIPMLFSTFFGQLSDFFSRPLSFLHYLCIIFFSTFFRVTVLYSLHDYIPMF